MTDYLVTDTELTSIADAIRTKGGTSASLTFPTGFVNAIDAIPSGGGGVELATISASGTKTYYTDENMVAHAVNGSLISVNAPVGSIVVRYGMTEPGITDTGITQIATWGSKTTATAVYKVTG